MQSLFDTSTFNSVVERMNKLTPGTEKLWGKMNVAQMLAHCKEAFKVPLSEKPMPRMFLGLLLGWAIKSKLYNEEPWKKIFRHLRILSSKMKENLIKKKENCRI